MDDKTVAEISEKCPIHDQFRLLFRERCEKFGVSKFKDLISRAETEAEGLAIYLIWTLQLILTPESCPSKASLSGAQFSLLKQCVRDVSQVVVLLLSGDFDIQSTTPLIEKVIENAPDGEVYTALFKLVSG